MFDVYNTGHNTELYYRTFICSVPRSCGKVGCYECSKQIRFQQRIFFQAVTEIKLHVLLPGKESEKCG